jgi:hypothetical protein
MKNWKIRDKKTQLRERKKKFVSIKGPVWGFTPSVI